MKRTELAFISIECEVRTLVVSSVERIIGCEGVVIFDERGDCEGKYRIILCY